MGVSYYKRDDKWRAVTKIDGKQKHIGYFDTKALATKALMEFEATAGILQIERIGSQVSVYFNGDDMYELTRLKYKYPNVPRGKLLSYALALLVEDDAKGKLSESTIMGYKD